MAVPNPLILAADNSPQLLPLLRSDSSLASTQDAHGYSLLHAAASYNHLDLLRALVNDFHVDVNIKDEDAETPLFVVETVEAAQVLIEELGADPTLKSQDGMSEGMTAEEKIRAEGDFTTIADYLKESRVRGTPGTEDSTGPVIVGHPPPLPPNVKLHMGTLEDEENLGNVAEADPEFRRRIEELAARDDFNEEEGQKQLRKLIADAIKGAGRDDRDVRRRVD
jgi:hypothetical protein